ncbi:MAG: hypothetical protein IPN70_02205 [Candidatus Moraniibacteriota bacterium]|nr:MAG: hypothetical protein IPN70_02205 [Candidatus Moranbacteria bacterium]
MISGTIFLLTFVFSGVLYLFSRGDAKNIERAKRSTFFALVGLLGILMIMIIFYTLSILLE